MKRLFLGFLFLTILAAQVSAQGEPVTLSNPSFEDFPRASNPPINWYNCGFPGESPPDVQPDPTFNVTKEAADGETYLGLVVRDNDTWESVSQRLSKPLEKGKCYEFSIHLARSLTYVSVSRVSDKTANYATPAKLRIYGGFGHCDKQYMLGETKLIINTNWKEYNFKFEPMGNYSYIVLEAFYETPTLVPYNGNILLDKASAIVPVPCDEVVQKTPPPTKPPTTPVKPPVKNPATTPKTTTPVQPPKTQDTAQTPPKVEENIAISNLKRSDLQKGKVLRFTNIYFKADSTNITAQSYPSLNDIYSFLSKNPDVIVEIGGHTNGLPKSDDYCDKLSSMRAKSVANYLIKKGISSDRVKYKGYGKRSPIDTNKTVAGRKRNQRVEVKILDFNT
ncbi:MAG: OmpA family protein [Saprospiraceae bacterium]|nr:OmpA family protein [Saprospiraceae bacterium]